jgi:hypothetical protein
VADQGKSEKIMNQPLPEILQELQVSINAAKDAAREARAAADEAKLASRDITKEFIRKILTSWDFLILMIVMLLATITAAITITLGLSFLAK